MVEEYYADRIKVCAACGKPVEHPAKIELELGVYWVCNPFCKEFIEKGVQECKINR